MIELDSMKQNGYFDEDMSQVRINFSMVNDKVAVVSKWDNTLMPISYVTSLILLAQSYVDNFTKDEIQNINKEKREMERFLLHQELTKEMEEVNTLEKTAFVYLMIDNRNGLHKIGKSKDPKYREKTLQSEVPSVELVFKCNGYTELEYKLHEKFADKRVRGEWFNLDSKDIIELKKIAVTK